MTETFRTLTTLLRMILITAAATLFLTACGQSNDTQSGEDMADADASAPMENMADTATDNAGDMGEMAEDEADAPDEAALAAARRERVETMAASWSPDPVYHYAFDALDPSLSIAAGESASLFDATDDYWGLPRTPGYEAVDLNCTACHSLRIVMQQHATEERWDHLLTWMVEEQGMYPMPDDERALVLGYLVEHFGADAEE